jgi:N-acetyl-anhydromuramyl-L-alanine amidase AmpD
MSDLHITDVREQMPSKGKSTHGSRSCSITGIAIHHSASVNLKLGVSTDNALKLSQYHVDVLGWDHGAYHYVIHANGLIEYALDESIAGYHAGFESSDPEIGQYWNNHYLAVCLLGWFDNDRTLAREDEIVIAIPNMFTRPTPKQLDALLKLLHFLMEKHHLGYDSIRGHRELEGCDTVCPGANVDLDGLRKQLC